MDYKEVDGVYRNEFGETPLEYVYRMNGEIDKLNRDDHFVPVNGEYRNMKYETVNEYKVRILTNRGYDLTNFKLVSDFLINDNNEAAEDYMNRQDRIKKELEQTNKNNQSNRTHKSNRKPKRVIKNPILRALKKVVKATTIAIASVAAVCGFYYGCVKLGAITAMEAVNAYNRQTQNDGYTPYENIPAGYYNDHPLKVCISDTFSDYYQFTMKKGLDYLDDVAEGVKFDVVVDDINKTDADIKVCNPQKEYKGKDDYSNYNGWTYMLSHSTKEIKGTIYINSEAFHPFTPGNTLVHEMGHLVFNLKHNDSLNSVMHATTSKMFFSEQDKININTVLPPKPEVPTSMEELNSISMNQQDNTKNYIKAVKNFKKERELYYNNNKTTTSSKEKPEL